ncbi:phosphotransferase [Streptomyces sp. ADI96-02]|uniref:phosphotransferase n=1 Tax=Streptomyces sp. ADI96-02 TaxID=1522760 RepID=UPI000F5574EE|nr:phosphotransferase [Streptomyces sp. ADI96-02]
MLERVRWEELPAELRDAIETKAGEVTESEVVAEGLNCSTALMIRTEKHGSLFLKGVRENVTVEVGALRQEERVNGALGGISAQLRHRFRLAGWYCLTFEYVDNGRHADMTPGSSDLDAIGFALDRMQQLVFPNLLPYGRFQFTVPTLADRFEDFINTAESRALQGDNLLHTDINPYNILMYGAHNSRACVVDWAMPATGPAWVDPAYTAVRLMECGHTPAAALKWLGGFTSWQYADPESVRALVNAVCRQWTARVGEKDARYSNGNYEHLLGYPHKTGKRPTSRKRPPG